MRHLDQFEIDPGVRVTLYPEEDPDYGDEISPEFKRLIDRGDVQQVVVIVETWDKTGELVGRDSLGCVTVGVDDHKQEVRDAIVAHEMIETAKADLNRKINAVVSAYPRGAK